MIQLLATKYQKHSAYFLAFVFYLSTVVPAYGADGGMRPEVSYTGSAVTGKPFNKADKRNSEVLGTNNRKPITGMPVKSVAAKKTMDVETGKAGVTEVLNSPDKTDIDGPSQPEMSSFKPAGTNDMVNLFTGDFSYNIALMDVGGYPVNIFYDGGIGMEQEASWVGLGWNINPGNVNRNMRGVPDDFNGTEKLVQEQNMKKNVTWGVSVGADWEKLGMKKNLGVGVSLGFSVNNYLGPALELGGNLSVSFSLAGKVKSEKYSPGGSVGLGLSLSSRSGLTVSPDASLQIMANKEGNGLSNGKLKLSTGYNSRTGIKALQIAGQMSFNSQKQRAAIYYGNDFQLSIRQSESAALSPPMLTSSISFTKPSYVPSMRTSITNSSGAGRFQLGPGFFGIYPSLSVKGYGQVSTIEQADRYVEKPMVGYIYADKANNNPDVVMDFSRFNDQEVTPKTTIISVPQYAFDVFSIQGEGTGGTIRAYRSDIGYVRDNFTTSKDKSWSVGVDVGLPMPQLLGLPGHMGGNFNTVKTPSTSGDWEEGNKLKATTSFGTNSGLRENIYFRNPGENSVLHPNQYDSIGGTDLVRFKIGGTKPMPTIEPVLQRLNQSGNVINEIAVQKSTGVAERKKRTQVTTFLTAEEAMDIGLDKKIRSYKLSAPLTGQNKLDYDSIDRNAEFRKPHHISQITVAEADGKRYIYGTPVYNLKQIDLSFTVGNDCSTCDKVPFNLGEESVNSNHINSGVGGKDGYVQKTVTPPYAHSFLLSGLLSPDYVDINNDGITEDDLGGAVKFNYTKTGTHNWRTPLTPGWEANSNPGKLSEKKDDKAIISYGERESWYLHSIESKTMIAFFTLSNRNDGKGALDSLKGVNYFDNSVRKLEKIDLYNKADLKKNGMALAKPVKTVHFGYNYTLCNNTPDNQSGGKLTLEKIWFTYNGQARTNKNQYIFSYTKGASAVPGENPDYEFNASDRWGVVKPASENPLSIKNRDYPYSLQEKNKADKYANAWNLKKILLPSGGQIEVEYESDDYAFVQNKRAAVMSEIIGFGSTQNNPGPNLYSAWGSGDIIEHDYIFIKVPVACAGKSEVYERYLKGVNQIAVKLLVNMPKGQEYLTSYATINDYGTYSAVSGPAIWIKMNRSNGSSPLSQTAIEFLREQLPGQAFPGFDVSDQQGIKQVLTMLEGWWHGVKSAFADIPKYLKGRGLAQSVVVNKSFVRLNDADGYKYGGGQRVKKVVLKDNWDRMTNQFASAYGQEYTYTTTEVFNGTERTISSGVASYEPSIGGEENPFQEIVKIADEVPLGPTSYGAIEMPVMDAFFPAPVVGYGKVTVQSIGKKQNTDTTKKTRSAVGRQVTEFYTAKDFPVYYNHSKFDPATDVEHHVNIPAFLYNYARDSRALSQGFLVVTNDMHGKVRSQSSYAENDPSTRINYTENFYRNTGIKGFDDKFDFIHNNLGGEVIPGNMGIDIELMTDARQFIVKSTSLEFQGQVDNLFPPIPPFFPGVWVPTIWPVVSESKNSYRAVTTTKVVNYHAVLDSVRVMDKGSVVTTKNLVYDAETGQVVVNRTNNEFDKPIYSVSYPAYWAYSGMGLAYKNIDAVYTGVTFYDGRITAGMTPDEILSAFESGDELYITNPGSTAGCDPVMASPGNRTLIWALDTAKNSNSLTNPNPYFIFIDSSGKPYTRTGTSLRIVRSGKRNMLGAPAASVALMTNPIDPNTHKLFYSSASKIINSSAVEYKEKWQVDNDVFKRYQAVVNPQTCEVSEVINCEGYLEKKINPYVKGLLGNFRGYRNMVFYGERTEADPLTQTNLPVNGFLSGFNPYWSFNGLSNLVPDVSSTKWVWNSEATRFNSKGMELETKDALNIYTAAQYGYKKTLPLAIANNSYYGEMFFAGFEEDGYDDLLNKSDYNECAVPYIDFSGKEEFEIVSSTQLGFRAHTGKMVLKLAGNGELSFDVNSQPSSSYSLQFQPTQAQGLTGGAPNFYSINGCGNGSTSVAMPQNTYTAGVNDYFAVGNGYCPDYLIRFYLQAPTTYSYPFESFVSLNGGGYTLTVYLVEDINSPSVIYTYTEPAGTGSPSIHDYTWNYFNIPMCAGKFYLFEMQYEPNQIFITPPYYWPPGSTNFWAGVTSYPAFTFYESIQLQSNCSFTSPIPADDKMLHPSFYIPEEKKMAFSAWVRESNTNVASYLNNEVHIKFGTGNPNNVVLKPSGHIIEGWQRYEGYFTAPSGVNSMDLEIVNNSGSPIYFDDIRIHPFNSNMKSYVYDPVNLRLTAQLDANNYASYYEYDEEGTLIRTKVETTQGIKTVTESRSAKQKNITGFQ